MRVDSPLVGFQDSFSHPLSLPLLLFFFFHTPRRFFPPCLLHNLASSLGYQALPGFRLSLIGSSFSLTGGFQFSYLEDSPLFVFEDFSLLFWRLFMPSKQAGLFCRHYLTPVTRQHSISPRWPSGPPFWDKFVPLGATAPLTARSITLADAEDRLPPTVIFFF